MTKLARNAGLASLAVVSVAVLSTEAAYRCAAPADLAPEAGDCVVLVLGYPSRADGSPDPVQRFRVEAAVERYRSLRCSRMILSGGAARNEHVEADAMAAVAQAAGIDAGELVLERSARSTWENVGCSLPYTRDAERVFVVSDALHARRAVRYACRQHADLCGRYRAAGAEPPARVFWWRWATAANELRVFLRDRLLYESGSLEDAPTCGTAGAT